MKLSVRVRLSAMMFMQYMMLPVWFNTVVPYVNTLPGGGKWSVWCGMLMGFGMLASPLLGMFADRFLNAEKVLALADLVYAALLGACFFVRDPAILFVLLVLAAIVNMPGWSLGATIAMANSSSREFPSVRIFGSLGWVASAVFSVVAIRGFGFAIFDKSPWIFAAGAFTALLGAGIALLQPPTPPVAKGKPMSVVDALGLRALVLFRNRSFAVMAILLVLAMVPFQWYMSYNSLYLDESGFKYLALTQNLGQVGELMFLLAVPLMVKRLGYAWAMVVGVAAIAFRYGAFLMSIAFGCHGFDFGGILVQGLIFSLLVVGAQMFVDDNAPAELRNQAQGLIMMLIASVGVFASVFLFDALLRVSELGNGLHDWRLPFSVALGISIVVALAFAAFAFNSKKAEGEIKS